MSLFKTLKTIHQKVKNFVEQVLTHVSVVMTYVVGIGATAIVAKIFGKQFLNSTFKTSSWVDKTKEKLDVTKMY